MNNRPMFSLIGAMAIALIVLTSSSLEAGDNWPQFRGPTGQGFTDEKNLPLTWGGKDKQNVLWQAALPGEGHASPIVWGDRVFTCTVSWPADAADRKKVIPTHHLTCFNTADGAVRWDTVIPPGPWLRNDFRSGAGGGYAAPTPATDGKLIYCVFGSAVIAAVDFNGKIVWRKELKPYTFDVTVGGSPVLYGDTVILLCAMAKKSDSRIVAFDKATGEVKWETPMPTIGFSHSTPLMINAADKPQMIVAASGGGVRPDGVQSFDPATGRRLWWASASGDASSPAFGAGVVYVDSGRGGSGVAIDPTGRGDVTQTHTRWTLPQIPEAIGSPTIVDGRVYRLHVPGVLKCFNAANGERIYSDRLPALSSTWASPIVDANQRLYFVSGGKSVVIQSGPDCHVLATNDLGDANHASPAVAGGRLYIMGMKMLHCIGGK